MQVLLSKDMALSQAFEAYERCTQDREMRDLALAALAPRDGGS